MVAGDVNDMASSLEKLEGGKFNFHRATIFISRINECRLIDLGWNGSPFTWMGKRRGGVIIRERLDGALANEEWCMNYPDTTMFHLPKILSDHHPIL